MRLRESPLVSLGRLLSRPLDWAPQPRVVISVPQSTNGRLAHTPSATTAAGFLATGGD